MIKVDVKIKCNKYLKMDGVDNISDDPNFSISIQEQPHRPVHTMYCTKH
jgi:hypothetical protein